ncbi:MAG: carbohydrate ABC transporter permease [Clostridia bacterium]|nr:carbohydrate ABC transporter permease [Clostridia bacterium]
MKARRWAWLAFCELVMIISAVVALFPIYFMVVTSFKTQKEYIADRWGLPARIAFDNYVAAFAGKAFGQWFLNSTILTVVSVLLVSLCAGLAAYALARMDFIGRRLLGNLNISLMIVPPVVLLVPLFLLMVELRLVNTYASAILIYVGLMMPFSTYLLTNFFKTIPQDIVDAAYMDGCSNLGIFWRIMLPLSGPAFFTLIVVNAMWVWNELLIALVFLQDNALKTLMVGLTVFKSRYNLNIPVTMAGLVVATVPIVALYLASQKSFIRGLTAGAVK